GTGDVETASPVLRHRRSGPARRLADEAAGPRPPSALVAAMAASAVAEVAGIEPTGRGSPVPLVLKTRGLTRRPLTSGCCVSRLEFAGHPRSPEEVRMKKLMLLVIVIALGAVVAKKKMAA